MISSMTSSASGPASKQPASATPEAHAGRKAAKKIVFLLVLMNVAAFAPAILLGVLGWTDAVFIGMLVGLSSFVACLMGSGWKTGIRVAVPFSVFCALTVWAAPYALAAALVLGAAAFWRGYGARLGLHNALMMSVISLGFIVAQPPKFEGSFSAPVLTGIVALGASLWVTLIMFLARKVLHPPALTKLVTARVLAFSSILALVIGGVTWCVVHFNLGQGGAWIILTILVVFQPYLGTSFRKAGQRVIGTAAGFVLAMIIGLFVSTGPALYVLGVILFMAAGSFMMLGKPYWTFVLFLTPAVVLFTSTGSTVDKTAVLRLEATSVGVVIIMLVMLALTPIAKFLQSKSGSTKF